MVYKSLILFIFLFISLLAPSYAASYSISLGSQRLSVIAFDSPLKSTPIISHNNLIRVYPISSRENEDECDALLIQGLSDSGSTEIIANTFKQIFRIQINMSPSKNDDLNLGNKQIWIKNENIKLGKNQNLILQLQKPINRYLFAGNTALLEYHPLSPIGSLEFWKNFVLSSRSQSGISDVVIPSSNGIYKFTVKIGENNNESSNDSLMLSL